MTDNIRNEKELRLQEMKAIAKQFESIDDENIRQYIFGKDGFSVKAIKDIGKYIQYFKNTLSLAFYFAYGCYRCAMDTYPEDLQDLTSHNSKRIKNSMDNVFVKHPVTQELIQFVLTDIQFELAQGDDSELRCVFGNMCLSNMGDFSFNPYFNLISQYNACATRAVFSRLELLRLFKELLKKLSFLRNYNLVSDGVDEYRFVLKELGDGDSDYGELYLSHILFRDDSRYFGGFYHLYSLDLRNKSSSNASIGNAGNLKYLSLLEDRIITFTLASGDESTPEHMVGRRTEEIYMEVTGKALYPDDTVENIKKKVNAIDQIHTVNYKYIKNLALAISDAISTMERCKKRIYNRFRHSYPYIFEMKDAFQTHNGNSAPVYEDDSLDWDAVIIMLLIEASPTVVLEYVIRTGGVEIFKIIAKNLYKRSFDKENLAIFNSEKKNALKEEVHRVIDEKLVVGEAGGFGKLSKPDYDKLFPRAAAMLILSKLTDVQEKENDDSLIYTGNLRSNISLLHHVSTNLESAKQVRYACIILGETLKHIICFYSGLFAYGKVKISYDAAAYNRCRSNAEISRHQKRLEKAFLSAAKEKAVEISSYTTGTPDETIKLIDLFVAFCEEHSTLNKNMSKADSKNLYTAVGKHEIMDIRVLKSHFEKLSDESGDIFSCDANVWVNTTLEILEYFKTGSFPDTPMDSDLFDTVYPFTAVFNKVRENSDGYKTVNFSLNIDIDDDATVDFNTDVNVLSEFTYDRSEVYYCLPNVIRSNYKWWIDPVLINFREFNDIFLDLGEEEQ